MEEINKNTEEIKTSSTNKIETKQDFACTTCDKTFSEQADLDKHWLWHVLQLEHMQSCCVQLNQVKIFKCDSCTSLFPDLSCLKAHQEKHVDNERIMSDVEEDSTSTLQTSFQNKECDIYITDMNKQSNINQNENNIIDRNAKNKIVRKETNVMDDYLTNKIVENEINDSDKIEINMFDENTMNKMNGNVINEINGNAITDINENEKNMTNEYNINKMDETAINEMDVDRPNKMDIDTTNEKDKSESDMKVENGTNKKHKNGTIEMGENEIKISENATEILDKNEKYSCTSCVKTFHNQPDLDKHKQWHSQQTKMMSSCSVKLNRDKMFKCDFCPSYFLNIEKLAIHQRKYFAKDRSRPLNDSDEMKKPYQCITCKWRFLRKSTLEAHLVLHEPFPHICECGIGYYQKHDLEAHRRVVHPNYGPPIEIKLEKADYEPASQLRPNNKIGPRLKACLTFKQPKDKTNKYKRFKTKQNTKKIIKNQKPIKVKRERVKTEIKMEFEKDENGLTVCTVCSQTFDLPNDLQTHLYRDHTKKVSSSNYKCNVCNKIIDVTNIKKHVLYHVKPFLCHICNKRYSQTGALKLHQLRHSGAKQFQCNGCEKSFYDNGSLQLHMRVHSGEKPFECKQCRKCFSDPSAYKRHTLIHTGLKPYKCEMCPKSFCDPSALFRHNRLHQGYKVSCPNCPRTFASNASLFHHLKQVHSTKKEDKIKHECDLCDSKFTLKGNLAEHMKNVHLNKKTDIECEICYKMFTLKNNLLKHIQNIHMVTPAVECEICHKKLKNAYVLKSHLQTVHLKKRYACEVCGALYIDRSKLKRHEKLKHGTKPLLKNYECDHCHESFHFRNLVRTHIVNKHLGIKCKTCSKAFSTSLLLKQHKIDGCTRCGICNKAFQTPKAMREHHIVTHLDKSEQQMYSCDYCNKQFPLKSRLRSHIQSAANHARPMDAFRCDHCSAVFSYKSGIVAHIWEKHMVALYCNICMKMFFREYDFREHKRNANCRSRQAKCKLCHKTTANMPRHLLFHGSIRLQCDMCGLKFVLKQTLIQHIKKNHTPEAVKRIAL